MNESIFDVGFMVSSIPEIIAHLPVTLVMAGVSCVIGLALGLAIALARFFRVRGIDAATRVYVSFIRGTPMLVQLYLVYYGIPLLLEQVNRSLGLGLSVNGIPKIAFAFCAFSFNAAAYMSETIRSSMAAVDSGQLEACYSVHMSTPTALRRVILPQAFVIAIPSLGNLFLSLIKETSLAFSISVIDLMAGAKIVGSRSFRFFEIYIVVSLIYWVVCIAIEQGIGQLEKRLHRYGKERN